MDSASTALLFSLLGIIVVQVATLLQQIFAAKAVERRERLKHEWDLEDRAVIATAVKVTAQQLAEKVDVSQAIVAETARVQTAELHHAAKARADIAEAISSKLDVVMDQTKRTTEQV